MMTVVSAGCQSASCTVCVCVTLTACLHVPWVYTASDLTPFFFFFACAWVCVCVHEYSASISRWTWLVLQVVWRQQMYGSRVPEASKLPVIFPMMQRSVHNHRESILLWCSVSASPAHRLTGCHNSPASRSLLIRTKQWEAHCHRHTACHNTFQRNPAGSWQTFSPWC